MAAEHHVEKIFDTTERQRMGKGMVIDVGIDIPASFFVAFFGKLLIRRDEIVYVLGDFKAGSLYCISEKI